MRVSFLSILFFTLYLMLKYFGLHEFFINFFIPDWKFTSVTMITLLRVETKFERIWNIPEKVEHPLKRQISFFCVVFEFVTKAYIFSLGYVVSSFLTYYTAVGCSIAHCWSWRRSSSTLWWNVVDLPKAMIWHKLGIELRTPICYAICFAILQCFVATRLCIFCSAASIIFLWKVKLIFVNVCNAFCYKEMEYYNFWKT